MRNTLYLAALVVATGCVTTKLTPEAEALRVTVNPDAVRGCQSLGVVESTDKMNGGALGQSAAEENANRRLKNDAAKLGANTLLLAQSSANWSGGRARGEAYKCPDSPVTK